MSTSLFCWAFVALIVGMDTLGQSHGQLPAINAIEGDCLPLETEVNPAGAQLAFGHTGTWFVQISNRYLYRKFSEILLGRPAADFTEIRQLKLTAKLKAGGFAFQGFGDKEFILGAIPTAFQANTQIPIAFSGNVTGGSPGIDMKAMAPLVGQLFWTDGICILIVTLCIHGHRAFSIWDKNPTMPEATKNIVYDKLIQKGFDKDFFEHITY